MTNRNFAIKITLFFGLLFWTNGIIAQTVPEPCTNPPNGVGCLCSTAGILCTPDDLDGFTFSMSSTVNDGDLPTGGFFTDADLCPGIGDQDGFPNNVNFFAFIVWCEDLTFDVSITNCLDNPDDSFDSFGVQMAMFANCGSQYDDWDPVECITEGADACFDTAAEVPPIQTFSATGLEIGGLYYFMLDGCARSTCDVTIDVVGVCGTGSIDEWTTGIEGPTEACVGATETYTAEDVNGAVEFYYYLDGVLIADGEDLTSTDITWDAAGVYTLCVDVSNLPCVEEDAFPPQDCMTITVVDIGDPMIMADPEILCPTETSTITVTGQSSDPNVDGYIIIVGPDGLVFQVDNSENTTLTYDMCAEFTAYYYADEISILSIPNVGDAWTPPDCGDDCCELEEVVISFEDDEPPIIINPPGSLTIFCEEELDDLESLNWTDNCTGSGTVEGLESPLYTICEGGTIKREWIVTDSCGNTTNFSQNIIVNPLPEFTFDMLPSDITFECIDDVADFPNLTASNGTAAACNTDTVIMPVIVENSSLCEASIEATWTYVDDCDRTIEHTQVISINPPEEAIFIDPPADMEVSCDAIPMTIPDLSYTNNQADDCEIMGMITPTVDDATTECGGAITSTWEFTDECDRTITHTQVITVTPPSAPTLESMPADVDVPCGDPIPDAIDITASNGEIGDCNISVVITPTVVDNTNDCDGELTYTWEYSDDCGTTLMHTQKVTLLPPDEPMFIDPPEDENITCDMIPDMPQDLMYSNNLTGDCAIEGMITPTIEDNSSLCGGDIVYTWEFTDVCDRMITYTQTISIDPVSEPEFIDPPENITVECGSDEAMVPGPLSYTNNEMGDCSIMGSVEPVQDGEFELCGGDVVFTWEFIDDCDNTITHSQTITVNPAEQAEFINLPDEITVSCEDFEEDPPALEYTNNLSGVCEIMGSVEGELVGNISPCGSDVQFVWVFTDDCDRTIEYSQSINVDPAPEPAFTNLPPASVTLACEDIPATVPNLSYTNGATGNCAISGSVQGFQSGSFDACGGNLTYTWTFTDECGFMISYAQEIEVLPAAEPDWIDPPSDVVLNCGDEFPEPVVLVYDNFAGGDCNISGIEVAEEIIDGDILTYTWTFTNDCTGNTIEHIQTIEGASTPDISADPDEMIICLGETVDLSSITITDVNNGILTFEYFDGNSQQIFDPIIQPTETSYYTIVATNEDGCSDDVQIFVQVDIPPNAGQNGTVSVCANFANINLFDHLEGAFDMTGSWFDVQFSSANIDDPTAANFMGVTPGSYIFEYVVTSQGACENDVAEVIVDVTDEVDFEILLVECNASATTYSVIVVSNGNNIVPSEGTVIEIDANTVQIDGIDINNLVVITAIDPVTVCISDIVVNPPNCDCPEIIAPLPVGNESICEGEQTPTLSVTVENGLMANWYAEANGGDPLLENSTDYVPEDVLPGVYSYFVESVDENGCVSLIRTEIIFEIFALPEANDIVFSLCPMDGEWSYDLISVNDQINSNLSFTFEYFENLQDAQNDENPISSPFVTADMLSTLIVKVTSGTGCENYGEILLQGFESPSFTIDINDEICVLDSNGQIVLTDVIPLSTTFSLDDDNYIATTQFDNLTGGTYTVYALTEDQCAASETITIAPGIELDIISSLICSSNGTASNADDDFYDVNLEVDGTSGQVNVTVGSADFGLFEVSEIDFTLPADGNVATIIVTDVETGCTVETETTALISCSTDCELIDVEISAECMDNGTSSDGDDDFYIVTISAGVINGAANNTFDVKVNDNIIANFEYGVGGTIEIPADGQSVVITISDNADANCFVNESIGDLVPCSNDCILSSEISFVCNNNETVGVPEDDFYTFTIIGSGSNTSSTFDLLVDGNLNGTYTYDTENEITIPADGLSHTLLLQDSENATCQDEFNTIDLVPCSGSCSITAEVIEVVCNNNGTASDELDDTYTTILEIELMEGSGSWYIAEEDLEGTGTNIVLGPYNISDGDVVLTISDLSIATCNTEITIIPPEPCSICDETVEAGPNYELDCEIIEVALEGSGSSNGTPSWAGPGGIVENGFSITTDLPGTYYFSMDFGEACVAIDSAIVGVSNDIPSATIPQPENITCDVEEVTLTAEIEGGTGNLSYEWQNESGMIISNDLSIQVDMPGNYYFIVTDLDTDCTSPSAITTVFDLTGGPAAVIYTDPGDILDCVIELIYITSDEEENVVYNWMINNQPVSMESIAIDEPSEIQLTAIDTITGCENSAFLDIPSLQEYPLISLESNGILTCENMNVTLDGSNSQMGNTISYNWYDVEENLIGSDQQMIDVDEEGIYFLELVDSENGCTNRDTIEVFGEFEYPIVIAGDDVQLDCGEEEAILEVSTENNSGTTFSWNTIDGNITSSNDNATVMVMGEGGYIVSIIDIESSCETIDTLYVLPSEEISNVAIQTMEESCEDNGDGVILIENPDGGTPPYSYFVDGEEYESNIIDNLSQGTYEIFILDAEGCDFDTTITISALENFEISVQPQITVIIGETVTLTANVNIPESEIDSVQWLPIVGLSCDTCLTTILTTNDNTPEEYTVRIVDKGGCEAEATVRLDLERNLIFTVPNIVSSNEDNNGNDNFTIYSDQEGIIIQKLQIFDRWGELVFVNENFLTNDPELGWDGKFDKIDVVPGVYVYFASIILPEGEIEILSGDVTVIR